jgi:hypothetical protein
MYYNDGEGLSEEVVFILLIDIYGGVESSEKVSHTAILFLSWWRRGRCFLLLLFFFRWCFFIVSLFVILLLSDRCGNSSGSGGCARYLSSEAEKGGDVFSSEGFGEKFGPVCFYLDSCGIDEFCDFVS